MQIVSEPRVSAIIPLFNKERTVEAALRSVAAQTVKDLEVIVVDDGSTDAGPRLVREFALPCVRLITQENAGPGAARNRGIAAARSPFLAFLDADDEWMPDYLERSLAFLEQDSSLAAVTFGWLDHPGAISSAEVWQRRGLRGGIQPVSPDLPASLLGAMVIFMWPVTTMVRAAVARRFGGFYEKGVRYGEDGHLWTKILLNAPVRFVMEPAAIFHHEASALSRNRRSMRPIEPFLTDPEDVRGVCPEQLRDLLERWLCLRALKTSCTLAYWGRWRDGIALRRRFSHPGCRKEPMHLLSCLAATPAGSLLGFLDRSRRGIR